MLTNTLARELSLAALLTTIGLVFQWWLIWWRHA